MSPRCFATPTPEAVRHAERRLWVSIGLQLRDARIARRWTVVEVATQAGVSTDVVYLLEAGRRASTAAMMRVATALGLRVELTAADPRRRGTARAALSADPVHSAMGEMEAARLRRFHHGVGIDEPYQHYQFAGRADVVAWDLERAALLHIENRTRFPDVQETAGSFNAKRAYLGAAIAERLGIRRWASETHVIAGLWSSEVLHAVRLRRESFRSLCPDPTDAFTAWWTGEPPAHGRASTFIALDPLASGRQRPFIGLEHALVARPRHRGYAEVAQRLATSS